MDYLPTPVTGPQSVATETRNELTVTPPESPRDSHQQISSQSELSHATSSQPALEDTQALSQFVYPPRAFADDVKDEDAEGVWGYLLPLDENGNGPLVLRKRDDDPAKAKGKKAQKSKSAKSPGGFLVGRHPECGK